MQQQIKFLEPADVQAKLADGTAYLIDVREPNEYTEAHIAGATLMPLSQFDPAAVAPPPGKTLIIHCRSGRRCGLAAEQLITSGYRGEIHRMTGGLLAWVDAGLPVQHGATA